MDIYFALAALLENEDLPFFFVSFGCNSPDKSDITGVATKIEEYVPTMIPTNKAKAKPLILPPPNRNNTKTTNIVVTEVMIVLLTVLFTALLMISSFVLPV